MILLRWMVSNTINVWIPEQESEITSVPVLTYFNDKLPITIQCDASQYELGAYMVQNGTLLCLHQER